MAATQSCADWRLGRCNRGAACKYSHDGLGSSAAGPSSASEEVCGDFKNGKCTRGTSCKFSHDISGLGAGAAGNSGLVATLGSPTLAAIMMAMTGIQPQGQPPRPRADAPTLEGPYNDPATRRRYYYNPQSGQSLWAPWDDTNSNQIGRAGTSWPAAATGKTEMCGDFKLGKCMRGSGCKFSHGETCADFRMGKCTRGESCKYSHVEPDDMTPECGDFKNGKCTRGTACKFRPCKYGVDASDRDRTPRRVLPY